MEDATTAPVIFKKSAKGRSAVRKKTGSEWSEGQEEQTTISAHEVHHENGAFERHPQPTTTSIGSKQKAVVESSVEMAVDGEEEEGLDVSVISLAKKKDKIEDGLLKKGTKREADERQKDKEKGGVKAKDKKSLLSFEEEEVFQ